MLFDEMLILCRWNLKYLMRALNMKASFSMGDVGGLAARGLRKKRDENRAGGDVDESSGNARSTSST